MVNYMFGSRADSQTQVLLGYFDHVFFFEDYGLTWRLNIVSGLMQVWTPKETHAVHPTAQVYVRGPMTNDPRYTVELNFLTQMLEGRNQPPGGHRHKILNKLSPLLLTSHHPDTFIVHNRQPDLGVGQLIAKGISGHRTYYMSISSTADLDQTTALPTLFQIHVRGNEYKTTVYARENMDQMTVQIESDGETDYRGAQRPLTLTLRNPIPKVVSEYALRVRQKCDTKYFDIDYFEDISGEAQILEWNNSPATAPLECHFWGHPIKSAQVWAPSVGVTIAQKSDGPSQVLALESDGSGLKLTLEDYCKDWHLTVAPGGTWLWHKNRPYEVQKAYLRAASPKDGAARSRELLELYQMLELLDHKVVGRNSRQFLNGSKPRQLSQSLAAALGPDEVSIHLPETTIVKGKTALAQIQRDGYEVIVKSISAVRSHVVDYSTFKSWDLSNLNYLPTLFQRKCNGDDVRVHVINDRCFAILASGKSLVDYRYDASCSFVNFQVNADLQDFCRKVARAEDNPLIGIDFVFDGENYACLEANPSPGWNWYYDDRHPFTKTLREGLRT